MSDSVSRLPQLLEEVFREGGVTICFCTLCSHQESYGHCYACPCGNHQPTPVGATAEEKKLQAAVSHLIRLLHFIAREKAMNKVDFRTWFCENHLPIKNSQPETCFVCNSLKALDVLEEAERRARAEQKRSEKS